MGILQAGVGRRLGGSFLVLAILIILLFLGNLRSTLVIALSIPISVLAAFALMYFSGFTLNIMSLGGIALGVGLIVDDAIVVLENIYRHVERDRISPRVAHISKSRFPGLAQRFQRFRLPLEHRV